MNIEMSRDRRAAIHAALGEPHRLAIVDALLLSDRTPSELRETTGLASNLLAFHLDVLEGVDLIERQRSQGDGRRRYIRLDRDVFAEIRPTVAVPDGSVLFVCTRNAARSQLAAALWRARTGRPAASAGTDPAERVDPLARRVADAHGLDLGGLRPRRYDEVADDPALVVSVCDRARESTAAWTAPHLHWSVADPAGGGRRSYERAYEELDRRVRQLMAVADIEVAA